MPTRRAIIAGLGATTIAGKSALSWPRHGKVSGITQFQQGALGGGGFAFEFSSTPDGTVRFLRGDYPNSYRWDSTSDGWINNSTSPYMDALGISVEGYGQPKATGCAWDNQTIYQVTGVMPGRLGMTTSGGGKLAMNHGQLYKSTDKGQTWFKPGSANPSTDPLTTPLSVTGSGHNFQGPPLSVDPNNSNVFYYMGWSGAVWVSYDGGVTITPMLALMRLALPSCHATANTLAGNTVVTVDSCPISGASAGVYGAYDATNPFALGGSTGFADDVQGATATTFSVSLIQKNDGTAGSFFVSPGVISGDEIFFGRLGGVVVDGSSGTIPNPGGSGVISKTVYFAWAAGATSMWQTTDGGSTFSAMTGGPTAVGNKIKISRDGILAGGGQNVLYVCTGAGSQPYWRWVATPPTGSGLAANTWTNFALTPPDGNVCICPDPLTLGKVVFMSLRGHSYYSTDYGTTNSGAFGSAPIMNGGDTPWLVTDNIIIGDAEFDPITSNKLWICDGVGVWINFPLNSAAQPTWTAHMQALQSLIIGQVLKTPSPNGKIYLALNQDRSLIRCVNINTVPDGYAPGLGNVANLAGTACYSLNDPTQVFCVLAGNLSQDAGTSSGGTQNWTALTTPGSNGWPSLPTLAAIVSRSTTEIFLVAGSVSNVQNILYGTKTGGVWSFTNTLFGGSPLAGIGTDPFGKVKPIDIDRTSGIIYYLDMNAKTLYKSTDGGATLTRPGAAGGVTNFRGGTGAAILAVHGNTDHCFTHGGYDGSGTFNPPNGTCTFTNDCGVTWHQITTFDYVQAMCVGPVAPGATYPTLYVLARLAGAPLFQFSVYRCTDFNPSTQIGTWVDVGANLKKVNCETFQGGLFADPEVWSSFYMATNDTGYIASYIT